MYKDDPQHFSVKCLQYLTVSKLCIFVYLWPVPHPTVFVTNLWVHGIYKYTRVSVHVCMHACMQKW